MNQAATQNPWSHDSLFAKAVLYQEQMENHVANQWQYGLWSSLTLELLLRSTLAHTSPILLAESTNWRNLTFAIGNSPTARRFKPTSISTSEVIKRIQEIHPEFNNDIVNFCITHTERRNSELHTGELVYTPENNSEWLAKYYQACDILLKIVGKQIPDFFADASTVASLIASVADDAAKSVSQDIQAHAKVWSNKSETDRTTLAEQSNSWATRHAGHRIKCPACKNTALLQGIGSGPVSTEISDDEIIQRQTMIPSSFECIACGLKIVGFSKLVACNIGNAYTGKTKYSAAEFFELYTEDDLDEARRDGERSAVYEPDFNE